MAIGGKVLTRLLCLLTLQGVAVTAYARNCRRIAAEQIVARKGDDEPALKRSQGARYDNGVLLLDGLDWKRNTWGTGRVSLRCCAAWSSTLCRNKALKDLCAERSNPPDGMSTACAAFWTRLSMAQRRWRPLTTVFSLRYKRPRVQGRTSSLNGYERAKQSIDPGQSVLVLCAVSPARGTVGNPGGTAPEACARAVSRARAAAF